MSSSKLANCTLLTLLFSAPASRDQPTSGLRFANFLLFFIRSFLINFLIVLNIIFIKILNYLLMMNRSTATTVNWKLDKVSISCKIKKQYFTRHILYLLIPYHFFLTKKNGFFRHKLVRLFILMYVSTWKWKMYKPKEMWSYILWHMLDFIYSLCFKMSVVLAKRICHFQFPMQ